MWYNQIKAAQPDKQAGEFQTYAFFSFFHLALWASAIYCYIKNDFLKLFVMLSLLFGFFHCLFFISKAAQIIAHKYTDTLFSSEYCSL